MPTVDWDDPATWARAYGYPISHHRPSTDAAPRLYVRSLYYPSHQRVAQNFVRILGLTGADQVVVMGAGWGWTVEALVELGIEAAGTDPSPYIQTRKTDDENADVDDRITAVGLSPGSGYGAVVKGLFPLTGQPKTRAEVANEDLSNAGSRGRVRRLFASNRVTVAISELVLDTLTDAEITDVIGRVAAVDPSNLRLICHYLATAEHGANTRFPHNVKTRDEWRSFIDVAGGTSHWIMEMNTTLDPCWVSEPGHAWEQR